MQHSKARDQGKQHSRARDQEKQHKKTEITNKKTKDYKVKQIKEDRSWERFQSILEAWYLMTE